MKVIIAPDSFKGSLTSLQVAEAIASGIKEFDSTIGIEEVPLADGGEGTVEALVAATEGELITERVKDPLGREIEAQFGILGTGRTAVIEMAAASGLPLLSSEERNPLKTTTYGTGQLIKAALDRRCEKLIIGIGGSATNDGGVGMAQALGARFLDKERREIEGTGQSLAQLDQIDLTGLDDRIKDMEIEVACDVDNPLFGPNGAAYVYAPQKGADQEVVKELDANLRQLARVIKKDLNKDIAEIPGAGAAGGLGAGLLAFLDADLKPGIEIVMEAVKLKEKLTAADLVITGEGQLDEQTINGKVPVGVAKLAREFNLPVVAVGGSLGSEVDKLYKYGIDGIIDIIDTPMKLEEAVNQADELIIKAVKRLMHLLNLNLN